jgi:hypothetical protein
MTEFEEFIEEFPEMEQFYDFDNVTTTDEDLIADS